MKKRLEKLLLAGAGIAGLYFASRGVAKTRTEDVELNRENPYLNEAPDRKDGRDSGVYEGKVKPAFDQAISFGGLVALSPLFGLISLAIVIDDPGSVFFTQKRIGKDKTYFLCHKFRTMKMSTPHDVPTHELEHPEKYITRTGRVLRRTSLDELPQVWDIFRGRMSIIGPRPALWNQNDLVAERDKYSANNIMPGLTGLAQIKGRDELEIAAKAALDGAYASVLREGGMRAFRQDLKCFVGTVRAVVKHEGVVEGGTGAMRKIETPTAQEAGFEDYGCRKTFDIDKSRKIKVLIAGADSYVGDSFKTYCEVNYSNIKCAVVDMKDPSWYQVDFREYDTVFHVAGIAHADIGRASIAEQENYYAVNTDLAIACCKKAREEGVKQFIFMSSMLIYGGKKAIDQHTVPCPTNFYGNSKWLADKGVRAQADDTFHVAVLRPPMIYGKGSKGNYRTLSILARRTPVFPNIANKRSMLYIENLCEFVCNLALTGEGGVFFPQNREYSSTSGLVRLIGECAGKPVRMTRLLNPAVAAASHVPGKVSELVQKAFGNSCYSQRLSAYSFDYQRIGLKESIVRTESFQSLGEKEPLVSVIMAVYNDRPEYICESIDSIVNQTYKNFELLIMDDSTDKETRAAIDRYSRDPRVHINRAESKLGFVPSLNKGLNLARGEFIARMDGDDVADVHRFEKQVAYLQMHPSTDVLGCQIHIIDERSNRTGRRCYPLGGIKLTAFFALRSPVAHPAVMFRRSIIDAGYRYDETFSKAEDIDFWLRLYNANYRFRNLPETLLNFRVESDFVGKRVVNKLQEKSVLRARRKNFSLRHPVFSVVNEIMTYVRSWTPDRFKIKTYRKENGG